MSPCPRGSSLHDPWGMPRWTLSHSARAGGPSRESRSRGITSKARSAASSEPVTSQAPRRMATRALRLANVPLRTSQPHQAPSRRLTFANRRASLLVSFENLGSMTGHTVRMESRVPPTAQCPPNLSGRRSPRSRTGCAEPCSWTYPRTSHRVSCAPDAREHPVHHRTTCTG